MVLVYSLQKKAYHMHEGEVSVPFSVVARRKKLYICIIIAAKKHRSLKSRIENSEKSKKGSS